MPPPRLTFACELDSARLVAMVADTSVIDDLDALGARVTLMLSDFSPERAAAVQRLNAAAIPVVAIPLLPYEQGYYFTADNAAQAAARYQQWKQWTAQHGLVWDRVGLDIEPDVRLYQQAVDDPRRLPLVLAPRLADTKRLRRAAAAYAALVGQVRADGWSVESYQGAPAGGRWPRARPASCGRSTCPTTGRLEGSTATAVPSPGDSGQRRSAAH